MPSLDLVCAVSSINFFELQQRTSARATRVTHPRSEVWFAL